MTRGISDLQGFQDLLASQGQAYRGRRAWRVPEVHLGQEGYQEKACLDQKEIKGCPVRLAPQEREEQESQEQRVNQDLQGFQEFPVCQERTEHQARRVNREHQVSEGWRGRQDLGLRERRETKVKEESEV